MKKYCVFLLCWLMSCFAMADGPFRAHRFDSFTVLKIDTSDVVFVGNSITDMHDWAQAFDHPRFLNRGVSGALSGEILEHIDLVATAHPKAIFLMIGTNDLGSGFTPEQVAENVRQIVEKIQNLSPRTKIYLESILPSTVGIRTLEAEKRANELIRQLASDYHVTYIDLWNPLFDICMNRTNTLDGLHLKASGYKIWCDLIAPYLNTPCVYPSNTVDLQDDAGLWGSWGMRATYCSVLPVKSTDILFFGDEMVKCGEWTELLQNNCVRNLGTGWGYDETIDNIGITAAMVEAALSNHFSEKISPKAIVVYTGTGNVNGNTPLDSVKVQYENLLKKLKNYAPETKLYLLGLMPTETENGRIVVFNDFVRQWCEQTDNAEYVDVFTPLSKQNRTNPDFFKGNYLYGKGYLKVAEALHSAFSSARKKK